MALSYLNAEFRAQVASQAAASYDRSARRSVRAKNGQEKMEKQGAADKHFEAAAAHREAAAAAGRELKGSNEHFHNKRAKEHQEASDEYNRDAAGKFTGGKK